MTSAKPVPRRPKAAARGITDQESSAATEGGGRGERIGRAYDQLRELIVQGRLAPGSRIIESEIAERLGVSRTPTRSALHRLQQEGYVIGDGARESRLVVAPVTQSDMRELFHIVGQLEGLAARMVAEQRAADRKTVVTRLRAVNASLGEAVRMAKPDLRRMFDLDAKFHRDCVEAAAGRRLLALHDAFKPQTERYARLYVSHLFSVMATSVGEHDIIIRQIAGGDAAAAQAAMEANWRNAAERLATVINAQGEFGSWF